MKNEADKILYAKIQNTIQLSCKSKKFSMNGEVNYVITQISECPKCGPTLGDYHDPNMSRTLLNENCVNLCAPIF